MLPYELYGREAIKWLFKIFLSGFIVDVQCSNYYYTIDCRQIPENLHVLWVFMGNSFYDIFILLKCTKEICEMRFHFLIINLKM